MLKGRRTLRLKAVTALVEAICSDLLPSQQIIHWKFRAVSKDMSWDESNVCKADEIL